MHRFKNILLYIDPERIAHSAIERVKAITTASEGRVTVLTVFEADPDEATLSATRQRVREALGAHFEGAAELSHVVTTGRAYLEIIRRVLRRGHDLVVKAIEHEEWYRTAFFSTTDQRLLRKCPVPVMLVDPDRKPPLRRVLAAVDLWAADPDELVMNDGILSMARNLASLYDAEFHVVYVERYYAGKETESRWEELTKRWGEGVPGKRFHFLRGDPRAAIPQLVHNANMDLLVMGTVARTGIPGLIIGNTAEAIITQLNCALLALKPPGYESPVTIEE